MAILEVHDLVKEFRPRQRTPLRAVDSVSFSLQAFDSFGIIGDSGAGKSTLAHCLVRLIEPTSGTIRLGGTDWLGLRGRSLRRSRRKIQMVFQDPGLSLNPFLSAVQHVEEPLAIQDRLSRPARRELALETLRSVGFDPDLAPRPPGQLSGGQKQRVAIARAVVLRPDILVADEPTSALDSAAREGILELLTNLRSRLQMSLILISHDFATVRRMCGTVAVMRAGRFIEYGETAAVFSRPCHKYTRDLVRAASFAPGQEDPPGPRGRWREAEVGHWVEETGES